MDDHKGAPRDVTLYHRVGADWQPLPTTLVDVTNGQANYTASSPGFSLFAITGRIVLSTQQTRTVPAPGPVPGLPLKTLGIIGIFVVVLAGILLLVKRR